jgi:DMSO/TMAO reductase YedYZ molybdopterin-dependent catalytic subunit
MLKKSIGFNWGPCAVSTSHWTGVRLGDLLRKAGVKQGGGYVSFKGPNGELPKGDDGSYGEITTRYMTVVCHVSCASIIFLTSGSG